MIKENNARIGIWWCIHAGSLMSSSKPVKFGELDGIHIRYSSEEKPYELWNKIVADDYDKGNHKIMLSKDGLPEYGEVAFNLETHNYEITCNESLINDSSFRCKIIALFELQGNKVEFIQLQH